MKNPNYVEIRFGIFDFEDNGHEKISHSLKINPAKLHYKGQNVNPRFSLKAETNAWFLHHNLDAQNSSFEDQMNALLDILEPKIAILSELSQKYYCEFSCAVFVQNKSDSTPWIHLGKRYNDFIKKVNVEIDFDIYN